MAEALLAQAQQLINRLSLLDQARLMEYLSSRMEAAILSASSPVMTKNVEQDDPWGEFFKIGDTALRAQRFARRKNLWEQTTMADEIIEELWSIKDNIARDHAYSIDALVAHLQAKGLSLGQHVVDLGAMKHEKFSRPRQQPSSTT